ncbi:MAG: DJ-1/PfpI family protein [Thalassospira sp.]|uniref:DJ-1/PfpI family protein n=1 Tax=Thalassospira sp. TaxID=1912094 RepID=UPI003A8725CD
MKSPIWSAFCFQIRAATLPVRACELMVERPGLFEVSLIKEALLDRPYPANEDDHLAKLRNIEHVRQGLSRYVECSIRIAVILLRGFSKHEYHCLIAPFNETNAILEHSCCKVDIFRPCSFHSSKTTPVGKQTSEVRFGTQIYDLVVVVGGAFDSALSDLDAGWIRRQHRHGATIGAISSGVLAIGRCGLLDGRRCTTHWRYLSLLESSNARAIVTGENFEMDRRVFTSPVECAHPISLLKQLNYGWGEMSLNWFRK